MVSNPNVIQDAYKPTNAQQFWDRMYVIRVSGKTFQVDVRLEKGGIGQGHARCSVWTPNGWALVNQIFDGEPEADGSRFNASTYSRKTEPLIEWSGEIIHTLVDRALDIIQ